MSTSDEADQIESVVDGAFDMFGSRFGAFGIELRRIATHVRALRAKFDQLYDTFDESASQQANKLTTKEFHGGERGGGKSEQLARPPSWRDVEERSFTEPALYEALTMLRAGLLTREQALIHAVLRLSLERERLHAMAVEMLASQQVNKRTS